MNGNDPDPESVAHQEEVRCQAMHGDARCTGWKQGHGPIIRDLPFGGQEAWEHYGAGLFWGFIEGRAGSKA